MNWPVELYSAVVERAGERCEYCLMHQALQGATFHIEHVVPRSRGGTSRLDNLALACPGCNLHKADRIDAADPETGITVALYNPRLDRWSDHFVWSGDRVEALTPIGRATIAALDLNHRRRRQIRVAEAAFQLFPPDESEA